MANRLLVGANLAVRAIWAGNRVLGLAFLAMLALSVPFHAQLLAKIATGHPELDPGVAINGLRAMVSIGVAWCLANDRLLSALLGMIESARSGDPFVATNAARLRTIGWVLLAMQLLDFIVGRVAAAFDLKQLAANHSSVSLSGWLSVLLVFVLAQVFEAGTALRDDLEGTV